MFCQSQAFPAEKSQILSNLFFQKFSKMFANFVFFIFKKKQVPKKFRISTSGFK